MDLTLLFVYVGFALVVSFVCSILEATLLASRVVELEARKEKGDKGAEKLLVLKGKRVDDAISAILVLNTVAHTAGVAGAGIQAAKVWPPDDPNTSKLFVGLVFPLVLTILILVLTEIIPKTLGAVYASRLTGTVARVLGFLVWIMTPVLYLTRLITGVFTPHHGPKRVSRAELSTMVAMAAREGTLKDDDSRLVSNVLRSHEILVEDVMTPRTVIAMLPNDATVRELLDDEACRSFSRIPVHGDDRDHVVGYVLQREVLAQAARGLDPETPIERFRRPALFLDEGLPVDQAMRKIIEGREHMALVNDGYGGISGLVSLEDLLETLLGTEILDEYDRVADLRSEAARLRDRRLGAMDAFRDSRGQGSEGPEEPTA
ncbi:MAG: CNNM domain-containing protein [Acidobacteriota bacterium]